MSPIQSVSQSGLASRITSTAMSELLPSRAVSVMPEGDRGNVELQRYRLPPGEVSVASARDHILVLNLAGRTLVEDASVGHRRREWVGPGFFGLTPAGFPMVRSWKGRPEVLLIYLRTKFVRGVLEDLQIDSLDVDIRPRLAAQDPVVHHLAQVLCAEAARPRTGSAYMVDSVARALTAHLLREASNSQQPAASPLPRLHPRRLNRVIECMEACIADPITLPEMAKLCGLSVPHFSRAFREAVGKPPHAYLMHLRFEKACELLERTELPITEIAMSTGFDTSQYFATAFRRKVGFTPSEWRSGRRD